MYSTRQRMKAAGPWALRGDVHGVGCVCGRGEDRADNLDDYGPRPRRLRVLAPRLCRRRLKRQRERRFACLAPRSPRTAHLCFVRSQLSEADHSGSLSGSRPMQQRLVCVEAGQIFSIQRMEVLTPQVSSIHCRLTRGRSVAL